MASSLKERQGLSGWVCSKVVLEKRNGKSTILETGFLALLMNILLKNKKMQNEIAVNVIKRGEEGSGRE